MARPLENRKAVSTTADDGSGSLASSARAPFVEGGRGIEVMELAWPELAEDVVPSVRPGLAAFSNPSPKC